MTKIDWSKVDAQNPDPARELARDDFVRPDSRRVEVIFDGTKERPLEYRLKVLKQRIGAMRNTAQRSTNSKKRG